MSMVLRLLFFPTKSNNKSSFLMPILNLLNGPNPNTHVYKSCSSSVSSNFLLLSRWIFKIFLPSSVPVLYVRRKTRMFCISYRHLGQYYVFCEITMQKYTYCKLDSTESCVMVWEQVFIISMILSQSFAVISYLQSRLNNLIVFMQFVF